MVPPDDRSLRNLHGAAIMSSSLSWHVPLISLLPFSVLEGLRVALVASSQFFISGGSGDLVDWLSLIRLLRLLNDSVRSFCRWRIIGVSRVLVIIVCSQNLTLHVLDGCELVAIGAGSWRESARPLVFAAASILSASRDPLV